MIVGGAAVRFFADDEPLLSFFLLPSFGDKTLVYSSP